MANAVWPASLPQFVESGVAESGRANVVRTPMDAGPPKVRRRYTAAPRPLRVQVELRGAEVDTFQAFVDDTLADGALPFDWVHPRTQAPATFRIVADTNKPPYELRHLGGDAYMATMELEIMP